MNRIQILAVLLVAGLLLPACGQSSSATKDKKDDPVWMPPEQTKPAKEAAEEPGAEPASVASFVTEWQELGLTEDQIQFKLTDGLKNGHLPAISKATEEEIAAIKAAGGSDDLVAFLGELELPEELPATSETAAPAEGETPADTEPKLPPLDDPAAAPEPTPAGP